MEIAIFYIERLCTALNVMLENVICTEVDVYANEWAVILSKAMSKQIIKFQTSTIRVVQEI